MAVGIKNDENDNSGEQMGKVLVAYFSASGNTEAVAKTIADYMDGDIFELIPVDEYTSEDLNWTISDSRVNKEHENENLQDIELVSTTVENFDSYDTVIIGYPIWWGIAAWPVNNFVKNNDFTGKTVIPFCTSTSSGLGNSGRNLAEMSGTGEWQEGQRFRGNASADDVRSWLSSLNLPSRQQNTIKENNIDKAKQIGSVTSGKEYYEDFLIDNVLSFVDNTDDLHYNIYIPDSYDDSEPYSLYITLPGYGAYYFQGVGINLKMEHFATEAKKYNEKMIIVAPQPNDWGETSKKQIIELTEYMLASYNINPGKVYISGYSGGGETLSLVVSERPDLYTAALHISSKWDGDFHKIAQEKLPVYFAIGEDDEYYDSKPASEAYNKLISLYEQEGLDKQTISKLAILDIKDANYFSSRGVSNQHGGGGLFAQDEDIMGWLFGNSNNS